MEETPVVLRYSPHARGYLTDNVVIGHKSFDYFNIFLQEAYERACIIHGQIVADMVRELAGIHYVNGIYLEPHLVSVFMYYDSRNQTSWDDKIDKTVRNAIKQLCALHEKDYLKRVVVKQNKGFADYNVTFQISDSEEIFKFPLKPSSQKFLNNLGPHFGEALVRNIMLVQGVAEVHISPWKVRVSVGEAFNWYDQVAPHTTLSEALKQTFQVCYGEYITFM